MLKFEITKDSVKALKALPKELEQDLREAFVYAGLRSVALLEKGIRKGASGLYLRRGRPKEGELAKAVRTYVVEEWTPGGEVVIAGAEIDPASDAYAYAQRLEAGLGLTSSGKYMRVPLYKGLSDPRIDDKNYYFNAFLWTAPSGDTILSRYVKRGYNKAGFVEHLYIFKQMIKPAGEPIKGWFTRSINKVKGQFLGSMSQLAMDRLKDISGANL